MPLPLVFGTCNKLKQLFLHCYPSNTDIKGGNNDVHIFLKELFYNTLTFAILLPSAQILSPFKGFFLH